MEILQYYNEKAKVDSGPEDTVLETTKLVSGAKGFINENLSKFSLASLIIFVGGIIFANLSMMLLSAMGVFTMMILLRSWCLKYYQDRINSCYYRGSNSLQDT